MHINFILHWRQSKSWIYFNASLHFLISSLLWSLGIFSSQYGHFFSTFLSIFEFSLGSSKSAAFRCFFSIFFRFSHLTGISFKCSATVNFSLASPKSASFGLFSTCSTVFEFSLGSSKSAAFRCLILERSRISDVQSCAY